MKYVDRLLQDTAYLALTDRLEQAEAARIFCRHGLSHFLDVARIAWIIVLENENLAEPGEEDKETGGLKAFSESPAVLKEKIYLTALLHDLGRLEELEQGTLHQEAGAVLAKEFLSQIGYPREEQQDILAAILGHRGENRRTAEYSGAIKHIRAESGAGQCQKETLNLELIIKEADNRSRNCFHCKAQSACKWKQERRNQTVRL